MTNFWGRIHLQHRIENEEQCRSLVRDLRGHIQQTFTTDIQDDGVLQEHYIKRVLQLRKVTITTLLIKFIITALIPHIDAVTVEVIN